VHRSQPALQADETKIVRAARDVVARGAEALDRPDLADDASLVASELVTNAILHGGGCTGVDVRPAAGGLRVEIRDASRLPPLLGRASEEALTGRGLRLVASVAARWGADAEGDGKVVWAELTGHAVTPPVERDAEQLLAMWDDSWDVGDGERRFRVDLDDVPTDLLLAAKSHVDNIVRELTLASAGAQAGQTQEVPEHLRSLVAAVVDRFAEARVAIKRQALAAARRGDARTGLVLELPLRAADAAEEYVRALDAVDAYCRAQRLLTLETPPQHQVFRRWYVEELVRQLRAAAAGRPVPPRVSFERRLLAEVDRVAKVGRAAEREARLYTVAAALAGAASPEAVASVVLNEGVAALGAAAGGVLLATDADRLALPGAVGYDEAVLARLRDESPDAELPAAVALRTGQAVWLESRAERDERFPELAGLEASTVAVCAVPLELPGRPLGALRFSFTEERLFDEDERRFVLTLAAQTAQALDRAQLQQARIDVSRRLQRSLLPPSMPSIPGLEVAAIYHPFGDGIDVGGDFYDLWPIGPGQWAIAIGDATGTGPEAAALTARVRHTLRALTMGAAQPAHVMQLLNTALVDAAAETDGERFCTAIFGVVTAGDPVEVHMASGGHPPPLLRRADGRLSTVSIGGALLGVFADTHIRTARTNLGAGDTLVLVTDGVLEARRAGVMFDTEGLYGVLAADVPDALHVARAIERAVLAHTGGTLNDDMAAVVLHVPTCA
jgi:serine phosphatase RsbU (regulator of sigma subunit)